jgi:hypothetical protein
VDLACARARDEESKPFGRLQMAVCKGTHRRVSAITPSPKLTDRLLVGVALDLPEADALTFHPGRQPSQRLVCPGEMETLVIAEQPGSEALSQDFWLKSMDTPNPVSSRENAPLRSYQIRAFCLGKFWTASPPLVPLA